MKLILSLDTCDELKASQVLEQTKPMISHVKIGHIPMAMGSAKIKQLTQDIPLFFDFKLHDIPNTVATAFANYQRNYTNLALFTIWGTMSDKALKAVSAEQNTAQALAVISLSSDVTDESEFLRQVERNLICGISNFITPSVMIARLRQYFGSEVGIYTPGIRFQAPDDHAMPFTPKQAFEAGADFIIVGRPILNDPHQCQAFFNVGIN